MVREEVRLSGAHTWAFVPIEKFRAHIGATVRTSSELRDAMETGAPGARRGRGRPRDPPSELEAFLLEATASHPSPSQSYGTSKDAIAKAVDLVLAALEQYNLPAEGVASARNLVAKMRTFHSARAAANEARLATVKACLPQERWKDLREILHVPLPARAISPSLFSGGHLQLWLVNPIIAAQYLSLNVPASMRGRFTVTLRRSATPDPQHRPSQLPPDARADIEVDVRDRETDSDLRYFDSSTVYPAVTMELLRRHFVQGSVIDRYLPPPAVVCNVPEADIPLNIPFFLNSDASRITQGTQRMGHPIVMGCPISNVHLQGRGGGVAVSVVPDVRASIAQSGGLKPRQPLSRPAINRCVDAGLQACFSLIFTALSCAMGSAVPVRLAGPGGPGTVPGRAFFTLAGVLGDMEEVSALLGMKRAWARCCLWCPRENVTLHHAGTAGTAVPVETHLLSEVRDAVLQWAGPAGGNKELAEARNIPVSDTIRPTWRDPTKNDNQEVPRSPVLDPANLPVMGCFGDRGRAPHLGVLPVDSLHCWLLGHVKRLYVLLPCIIARVMPMGRDKATQAMEAELQQLPGVLQSDAVRIRSSDGGALSAVGDGKFITERALPGQQLRAILFHGLPLIVRKMLRESSFPNVTFVEKKILSVLRDAKRVDRTLFEVPKRPVRSGQFSLLAAVRAYTYTAVTSLSAIRHLLGEPVVDPILQVPVGSAPPAPVDAGSAASAGAVGGGEAPPEDAPEDDENDDLPGPLTDDNNGIDSDVGSVDTDSDASAPELESNNPGAASSGSGDSSTKDPIVANLDRFTKCTWPKYHALFHLAQQVEEYGINTSNMEDSERLHVHTAKRPFARSSRRRGTMGELEILSNALESALSRAGSSVLGPLDPRPETPTATGRPWPARRETRRVARDRCAIRAGRRGHLGNRCRPHGQNFPGKRSR